MSVCFYNDDAFMLYVDPHTYVTADPDPVWHPVFAKMSSKDSTNKRTKSLTSDGHLMIQGGHDLLLVLHLPVAPPPKPKHPKLIPLVVIEWGMIIAASSSKAELTVASVTHKGEPLACCVLGPEGLNSNCAKWDWWFAWVYSPNSVVTQPTPGDYVAWIVNVGLGGLLNWGIGKGLDKGVKGPKKFRKQVTKEIAKQISKWVQEIGKGIADPGDIGKWIGEQTDLLRS